MPETENKKLDRYSYSKISTYKQCRFKYYLKYDQKNFLFSANIATDFGSLVHETEENIAKAIQAGQPVDYVRLKNNFIIECHKLALKYPTEFYSKDKSNRTYQEKAYSRRRNGTGAHTVPRAYYQKDLRRTSRL